MNMFQYCSVQSFCSTVRNTIQFLYGFVSVPRASLPPPFPPSLHPPALKSCLIVRGELKCRLFLKILAINKYVTQTTYYEHFLSTFIYKPKQGYVICICCFLN
jgi:hypothetical protein